MMYVDYDGVCCNFAKAASDRVGLNIQSKEFDELGQSKRNALYSRNCDTVDFWVHLEPMPDYDDLWGFIRYWKPSILTAYPMWSKEARDVAIKGKTIWNKNHTMVPDNRLFIVERKDKQKFAINKETGQANILIDDSDKNIGEWTKAGGVGILHTSAAKTIIELKILGFSK